jgi:hypothetical protein
VKLKHLSHRRSGLIFIISTSQRKYKSARMILDESSLKCLICVVRCFLYDGMTSRSTFEFQPVCGVFCHFFCRATRTPKK